MLSSALLAAALLAQAAPAKPDAQAFDRALDQASDKPGKVTFAELCREEDVLEFRLAPAPGAEEGEALERRSREDRRAAAKALGKGVTVSAEPGGVQRLSWDKPAGSQKECRARLGRLSRAFPGRVSAARRPSERLAEARQRMEGQAPEELRRDPKETGLLSRFFDSSRPGADAEEGVAAGLRDAAASPAAWGPDIRPRAQLPSGFSTRPLRVPAPASSERSWAGRAYDGAAQWAGDAWRTGSEWAWEAYRAGRAWTGDRISDLSTALGAPWAGSLRNGVQLPKEGPGYRFVRFGQWGTGRLVAGIRYIGARLAAAGAPAMEVGDMSYKNGGVIRRHRSHQNGRDVDVFFIGGSGRGFDVAANWLLLRSALDNPHMRVANVFISNGREAQLLAHARRIGDPLAGRAAAVMSFEPGHHDHFHIRVQ